MSVSGLEKWVELWEGVCQSMSIRWVAVRTRRFQSPPQNQHLLDSCVRIHSQVVLGHPSTTCAALPAAEGVCALGSGHSDMARQRVLSFTHEHLCWCWGKVQSLVCKTLQVLASSGPAGICFFLGHRWLS